MKKIIYTNAAGVFCVCTPNEGARLALKITLEDGTVLEPEGAAVPVDRFLRRWPVAGAVAEWAETEQEWLHRIRVKDVPVDATDVAIVDESAVPTDRTFRDAFRACPENGCRVDMSAARDIHKDRLRTLRAPKLAVLDIEFMQALEAGDVEAQARIAAKKQALRDVTKDPAISAATTPEDLGAVIPVALADS